MHGAARSLDEMSSPAKKRNEVAASRRRSPQKVKDEPTYMNLKSLQASAAAAPKSPLSPLLLPAFWSNTPLSQSFAASPPPGGAPDDDQGCNSIEMWNLRLELGRKLRQKLRTRLGTRFLAVD